MGYGGTSQTISYNATNHSLYFHFYTRDIAEKYVGTKVPFHRYEHSLANLHTKRHQDTGSAWAKQVDHNGEAYAPPGYYSCFVKNVSRTFF